MKKTSLILSLFAASLLVSCGASTSGGGTSSKTSSPEQTSSTAATTSEAESSTATEPSTESEPASESEELINPVLHVVFYERYVDQEILGPGLVEDITEYAKTDGYGTANVTWDYVGGAKVADFQTNLKDAEEKNGYLFDVILGGKAFSGCDYLNSNFSSYKVDGAALDFPIGDSTDRRLWTRNETENDDLIPVIINYVRALAGLPEEEDSSEDTSSEESIPSEESQTGEATSSEESIPSEESSVPAETSEEGTSESSSEESQEILKPVLHVVFYERYVDKEVLGPGLAKDITDYAETVGYSTENVTWDYVDGAKVADFETNLKDAETANGYLFDVILGGKAYSNCNYINGNFSSYKVDGTALDFPIGDNTDRRLWTRNETENDDLIPVIIDYVRSLVDLPPVSSGEQTSVTD